MENIVKYLLVSFFINLATVSNVMAKPTVTFHQEIIEGLNYPCNENDEVGIFKIIFEALPSNIVVYPSENYYYFELYCGSKYLKGNLRFDPESRTLGKVHFAYYNPNSLSESGGYLYLGHEQGFKMIQTGFGIYQMEYDSKLVEISVFESDQAKFESKREACVPNLRKEEITVGVLNDDSGIQFGLLFDTKAKQLFYVLCKKNSLELSFTEYSTHSSIDSRSSFVFLYDQEVSRYVLIGVKAFEVFRNTHLDGPFDQLPDNDVEFTNLLNYLHIVFPQHIGKLNKYGDDLNDTSNRRILLSPYLIYASRNEFKSVDKCMKKNDTKFCFRQLIQDIGPQHGVSLKHD